MLGALLGCALALVPALPEAAADPRGGRGFLGIKMDQTPENRVAIVSVESDTAAANAGLRAGDVVLRVAGEEVTSESELARLVSSFRPGTRVAIEVRRGGAKRTYHVTLGARPPEANDPASRED